jgi:predicted DNA-binding transcriptional regulator AlpA
MSFTPPPSLANAARVRARYSGITEMTLWRWLRDEDLGFPKPYVINGRRLWDEAELDAFDRTRRPDGEAA